MTAAFYGFQFPHHGKFSAFTALSSAFEKTDVRVYRSFYPSIPKWIPGRISGPMIENCLKLNEQKIKNEFYHNNLVHYFFPENSLFNAPKWKKSGPMVLTCHQPVEVLLRAKKNGRLQHFFEGLKVADAIILMASCELDAYREISQHSEVTFIPHGVDSEFFSPSLSTNLKDNKFRVLTVGSWLRDYNLWANVVEKIVKIRPDIEFSVLGDTGQLKKAMETLKHGHENVRVLKSITDEQLRDEYRRADVFYLPLIDAWANNALLESMSCGCPVIVTDLPATNEYARNNVLYVEKGSIDASIEALLKLYYDRPLCRTLGQNARQMIVSKYEWPKIVHEHLHLYSKHLAKR